MFKTIVLAVTIVSSLAASTAQADHRSRGGSWRGGGWGGIGIGGRSFQLYIGPGGVGAYNYGYGRGWGGGFGPGFYSPGYYYGPTYSTPYYYTPGQVYSDGVVVPSVPQAPIFDGGSIVLTNPATNTESVEYALNGQSFVMKPGQTHRFTHDRDWIVEFDRGVNNNLARYSLKSKPYKFKQTANGWELFEQAESRPATGVLPPPPTDDPANSNERLQPADEPQRKDAVPPPVPEADQPKPQQFTSPSEIPETVIPPRQIPQR